MMSKVVSTPTCKEPEFGLRQPVLLLGSWVSLSKGSSLNELKSSHLQNEEEQAITARTFSNIKHVAQASPWLLRTYCATRVSDGIAQNLLSAPHIPSEKSVTFLTLQT